MNPQTSTDNTMNGSQSIAGAATMPLPSQQPPDPLAMPMVATVPQDAQISAQNPAQISAQIPTQQGPPTSLQAPFLAPPPMTQPAESAASPQTVPVYVESAAPPQGMPTEAADTDVIEKEWIIKAKEVIAETRSDPYKQVRELNKIRADYMKKRYDKDIKLPEA